MINIDIIVIVLGLIVMELIAIFAILSYRKNKNKADIEVARIQDETNRIKLYSEFDFDKIDTRIESYINYAGKEYKMNNFEYKDPEDLYLTEEMMNDMIKAMVKDVMLKITPAIISLLELSYNINDEEELISFLYGRCREYVLQYSFEVNAEIED